MKINDVKYRKLWEQIENLMEGEGVTVDDAIEFVDRLTHDLASKKAALRAHA